MAIAFGSSKFYDGRCNRGRKQWGGIHWTRAWRSLRVLPCPLGGVYEEGLLSVKHTSFEKNLVKKLRQRTLSKTSEFGVRIKKSMLLRSYERKKHIEKFIKTRLTYLVKVQGRYTLDQVH